MKSQLYLQTLISTIEALNQQMKNVPLSQFGLDCPISYEEFRLDVIPKSMKNKTKKFAPVVAVGDDFLFLFFAYICAELEQHHCLSWNQILTHYISYEKETFRCRSSFKQGHVSLRTS